MMRCFLVLTLFCGLIAVIGCSSKGSEFGGGKGQTEPYHSVPDPTVPKQ